jgi:hypothetical protein
MRKRLLLTIGLAAALLLGGCAAAPSAPEGNATAVPPAPAAPRIVFREKEYDFGRVKQSGGIVRHDFPFTYEGNAPLRITGTPTSCACTGASADRTTVNPGESGVLTVAFNPNLHAEPPGRFFKTALLLTEPPLRETPEVTIFVEVDLDLGPGAFELKDEHGDEEGGAEYDDAAETSMNLGGAAQAGHIAAEAIVINAANIEELRQSSGEALPDNPEGTAILLTLDNHQEDLSRYDYRSAATLNGAQAQGWQPLSSAMGGHHVTGVLTFKSVPAPATLRIAGLSVGEVIIPLVPR